VAPSVTYALTTRNQGEKQRDELPQRTLRPEATGGYRFESAFDKQKGVWTEAERAAEAARRREAHEQAASQAFADMQAKIDAIEQDGTLTRQQRSRG
jgi:hypothetical protein